MHWTEPEVYCLAETQIDQKELERMLSDLGAKHEMHNVSDIEELVEIDGRLCYMAFEDKNNPGSYLNPNVTRIREGNDKYIANIKRSGHGSVIEHGTVQFTFHNISRIFSHELVRHRVGSFSQESLRYVRVDNLGMWLPNIFKDSPEIKRAMEQAGKDSEKWYQEILETSTFEHLHEDPKHQKTDEHRRCSLDCMDDLPFDIKKKITSAARRVLPIGLSTTIAWTTNMRNLRHVIEMRTSRYSEEEMRLVFGKVADIAIEKWPNLFNDYTIEIIDGIPEYSTKSNKI